MQQKPHVKKQLVMVCTHPGINKIVIYFSQIVFFFPNKNTLLLKMLDKKSRVQLKKASSQTTLKYLDPLPIQLQRIAWMALCLNSKETDAQESFSTKTTVPPPPPPPPSSRKLLSYFCPSK